MDNQRSSVLVGIVDELENINSNLAEIKARLRSTCGFLFGENPEAEDSPSPDNLEKRNSPPTGKLEDLSRRLEYTRQHISVIYSCLGQIENL